MEKNFAPVSSIVHQTTNTTTNTTTTIGPRTPFKSPMFLAMLSLAVSAESLVAPLHPMVDAAVMNVIENKAPDATFGAQR